MHYSVPRPEVVKRIRTDARASNSPKPPTDVPLPPSEPSSQRHANEGKVPNATVGLADASGGERAVGSADSIRAQQGNMAPRDLPLHHYAQHPQDVASRPHSSVPPPQRLTEAGSHRADNPTMPPPSVPSQTPSAQELRETARQSVLNLKDKSAERNSNTGVGQNGTNSTASNLRVRSPSPTSPAHRGSGGGPRNGNAETRQSGGDKGGGLDDRRRERDGGRDALSSSSISASGSGGSLGRRDSLTHNAPSERGLMRERVGQG